VTHPAPEWTVVVPVYNQPEMLARLLESLESLEDAHRLEVIVVDDCSTDDTPAAARAWCDRQHPFPARYLCLDRNSGPGRARNEGARAARGAIVLYTDADCVVTPGWARALAAGIDLERGIVGVAGRVDALSEESPAARYYAFNNILQPPVHFVNYLVTCNAAVAREPLLEVGGFSEDIGHPGGEDVEASILLWKRGWRFAFAEEALVYHDFRASIRNFAKTWYNYGQGGALVMHRQLAPQEIVPEFEHRRIENFWDGRFTRPAVTGFRSFFGATKFVNGAYRKQGLPLAERLRFNFFWFLQIAAHGAGWRQGRKRYFAEGGRPPAYFRQADPGLQSEKVTEDPLHGTAGMTFFDP